MRWRTERRARGRAGAAALAAACLLPLLAGLAEPQKPLHAGKGVWFPEYDDKGRLRQQFRGDEVKVMPGTSSVEVVGVRMEMYKEGLLETRVTADSGRYDRGTGMIVTGSPMLLERENMKISGVGCRFSTTNQVLEVFSNVKVVVRGAPVAPDPGGRREP